MFLSSPDKFPDAPLTGEWASLASKTLTFKWQQQSHHITQLQTPLPVEPLNGAFWGYAMSWHC